MINYLIDNVKIIFVLIVLILFISFTIYIFIKKPRLEQLNKVKEWLIQACIEAEKELKSGTGQLKLRYVYNKFLSVPSFSWIARIISFDYFESLVNIALYQVKNMLISNSSLAKYTYGDQWEIEIENIREQLSRKGE